MRTARLVTAAALATGLGVMSLPSSAAPAPKSQIVDPSGDSFAPMGGMDIVSGLFSTTGTTKKVGKKTVYTPKNLVVTITYADAPTVDPGASHEIRFNDGSVDHLFQNYAGESYYQGAEGGEVTSEVVGKTLVFTASLSGLGLKAGQTLSDLRVLTGAGDPVLGFSVPFILGAEGEAVAADNASTTAAYKIA